MADDPAPPVTVTLGEIFRAFLLTGATSFGGGVMASLLTVGGGLAAFPELKALTVGTYHWLTEEQLIHLYSLGQVAPVFGGR